MKSFLPQGENSMLLAPGVTLVTLGGDDWPDAEVRGAAQTLGSRDGTPGEQAERGDEQETLDGLPQVDHPQIVVPDAV